MEQLVNEQPTKERLVRRRTIENCIIYIKELDPQTDFTENKLRNLVKNDEIDYIKSGSKALVDLDAVIDYINRPHITKKQERCEVCM